MAVIGECSSNTGVDRISHLDEDVKAEILSRLPTKEAVRTCILSKAWLMTWTWIMCFCFDDQLQGRQASMEEKKKFSRLVQTVFHRCSPRTIRSFSLACSQRYEKAQVQEWISHVLKKGVQKLTLRYRSGRLLFPSSFFTCQTLEEVRLLLPCILKFPSMTTFKNLKILYITRVFMVNENDPTPGQLTFSFPLLEEFTMMCCVFQNVTALHVTAPLLCIFQMAWCTFENGPVDNFIVDMASSTCMKTFKWAGCFLESFILPGSPTVSEASMDHIVEINDFHNTGIKAAILLRQLSSVVHLELSIDIAEAMARARRTGSLPIFENLKSLKVESRFTGSLRALMELLRRTPNLRILDIHANVTWRNEEDWELNGRTLPFCVIVKLERMYFTSRFGSWIRVQFLKQILRQAHSLELLCIDAPELPYLLKVDIRLQLLLTPRASRNAAIVVE